MDLPLPIKVLISPFVALFVIALIAGGILDYFKFPCKPTKAAGYK